MCTVRLCMCLCMCVYLCACESEKEGTQELNLDKEKMCSESKCEFEEIFHEVLPRIPSDKWVQ